MKRMHKYLLIGLNVIAYSCTQTCGAIPDGLRIDAEKPRESKKAQPVERFSNEELIEKMIYSFAPEVRLHPNDPYRPASIPWYKSYCSLEVENNTAFFVPKSEDTSVFFGEDLNEDKTVKSECYVNVVDHVDFDGTLVGAILTYYFFYPYNGATVPPFLGAHEGDWEHVQIIVRHHPRDHHLREPAFYKADAMFYAAHGQTDFGKRVRNRDIPLNADGHPIVYSSWHGHASHPQAMLFNFQLDFTRKGGPVWKTWEHIVRTGSKENPSPQCPWIAHEVRWGGPNGPLTPSFQKTWRHSYFQTYPLAEIPFSFRPNEDGFNTQAFDIKGKIPVRISSINFKFKEYLPQEYWDVRFRVQHPSWLPFIEAETLSAPFSWSSPLEYLEKPKNPFQVKVEKVFLEGSEHRLVLKRIGPAKESDPQTPLTVIVEGIEPI